jgi:hypothetical protein
LQRGQGGNEEEEELEEEEEEEDTEGKGVSKLEEETSATVGVEDMDGSEEEEGVEVVERA